MANFLDEDFWLNLVQPISAPAGMLFPYLPDPDEIPAATLHGQPDEDFAWQLLWGVPFPQAGTTTPVAISQWQWDNQQEVVRRPGPGTFATRAAYVIFNGSEFMGGQIPTDSNAATPTNNAGLQDLSANTNFARVRPEGFLSTGKTNGQAVPLPTSPVDSYAYARSELLYLANLADTGAVPAPTSGAGYVLRGILFYVDPQLGTVNTTIVYYLSGNPRSTTNGSYNILALGFAKSVSLLSGVTILPLVGSGNPAPPGASNLVPNGDMELWATIFVDGGGQKIGIPDLWTASQVTQDGYSTQQPGITGNFAVGCNVGNAHGPANTQYSTLLSYPIAFVPGDPYQFSLQAYANPAITQGLYCRLHFRDANLANDVYITVPLTVGGTLGTGTSLFQLRFFMPQNGDSSVQFNNGGIGALTITGGPLTYQPAYCLVEIGNFQPNVSSTIIFDTVTLLHLAANALTPVNTNGTMQGTTSPLSQSGTTTTILVAATTWQYAEQAVSYNSGSVNPGSYGTWYIYASDPQLRGGSVTYFATSTPYLATTGPSTIYFGKITTNAGGGATGSGGGSGGGGPGSKASLT